MTQYDDEGRVLYGLRAGHARRSVEDRHFPEHAALVDGREPHVAALDGFDDGDGAEIDDISGVTRIAFAKDEGVLLDVEPFHGDVGLSRAHASHASLTAVPLTLTISMLPLLLPMTS
jgi:hypothetical protein